MLEIERGNIMEQTLVLIKPDGVRRALIGRVISRFEDAGLQISAIKMLVPERERVGRHYTEDEAWLKSVGSKSKRAYESKGVSVTESEIDIGRRIRGQLIDYLTSGPVIAMIIEGNEAVFTVRKIVGSTEPRSADPSSIRGGLSTDSYGAADSRKSPLKNLIHASEDVRSAKDEISVWFSDREVCDYERADRSAIS